MTLVLGTIWICVNLPHAGAQVASSPTVQMSESLKGRSDEELVRILIGGKSTRKLEAEARRANEVETHLPDRFWEMPPKNAAHALVEDNCNLKLRTQLKVSMRDENRQPPEKGSVQLRLEGSYYNIPRETLLDLSSDGRDIDAEVRQHRAAGSRQAPCR